MPHDPRKLLEDMHVAGSHILQHTTGRSLADYEADVFFRAAIERFFEIIGEAITRLAKIDSALADEIPERRRIVSFRNILAHGYDSIRSPEVWQIIEHDLPIMLQAITVIRARFPQIEE
jgi:uncharacterized protein with HEPN domain